MVLAATTTSSVAETLEAHVSGASAVSLSPDTATAAVALTNMGGTPLRATAVEEAIANGASAADAAGHAAEGTEPSSDTAASAEFRMHLARVLTQRALGEAMA